jgi:hypothetical protein
MQRVSECELVGILWGRRPPSAGGGPVLRRRPALRAGRRCEGAPARRAGAPIPSSQRKPWPQNGIREAQETGPILLFGIDFLFRRRQPPAGAGAAPNVPLPICYREVRGYRR